METEAGKVRVVEAKRRRRKERRRKKERIKGAKNKIK